jgi:hypothetical protein
MKYVPDLTDRIDRIFLAARALQYAIAGAPIDPIPGDALKNNAEALANALGELWDELHAEKKQ